MGILRGVHLCVLVLTVSACSSDVGSVTDESQDIRPDVVQCEEAAAHIRQCCPGASSLPDCHYTTAACVGYFAIRGEEYPVELPLSESDSQMYQAESCDELVTNGTCQQVWRATTFQVPSEVENDCGN